MLATQTVVGSSPEPSTNAGGHIYKYMDQKGAAAMLTVYSFSRYCTRGESGDHTSEKAHKGSTPGFETQDRHHQNSEMGCQWPHEKDFMSSKHYFLKKISFHLDGFTFFQGAQQEETGRNTERQC